MKGWLCSKKRKRHQRAMNKLVRDMNKNIEKDNLWQGRFYARQVGNSQFYEFQDRSGAELFVGIQCVDRKTGRTYTRWDTVNSWRHMNGWDLWEFMNWFIVEFIEVWSENPRPGEKV